MTGLSVFAEASSCVHGWSVTGGEFCSSMRSRATIELFLGAIMLGGSVMAYLSRPRGGGL